MLSPSQSSRIMELGLKLATTGTQLVNFSYLDTIPQEAITELKQLLAAAESSLESAQGELANLW